MKTLRITNLERVTRLGVNMYEIENAILSGDRVYRTDDYTYHILFLDSTNPVNYNVSMSEVLLNTEEGVAILIKRI